MESNNYSAWERRDKMLREFAVHRQSLESIAHDHGIEVKTLRAYLISSLREELAPFTNTVHRGSTGFGKTDQAIPVKALRGVDLRNKDKASGVYVNTQFIIENRDEIAEFLNYMDSKQEITYDDIPDVIRQIQEEVSAEDQEFEQAYSAQQTLPFDDEDRTVMWATPEEAHDIADALQEASESLEAEYKLPYETIVIDLYHDDAETVSVKTNFDRESIRFHDQGEQILSKVEKILHEIGVKGFRSFRGSRFTVEDRPLWFDNDLQKLREVRIQQVNVTHNSSGNTVGYKINFKDPRGIAHWVRREVDGNSLFASVQEFIESTTTHVIR